MNATKSLILEDEHLRVAFDAHTGALVDLVSKRSDWKVQRRPGLGRSFRMLVPLPEKRNNVIDGIEFPLADASSAPTGDRLDLRWEPSSSARAGASDISLDVTLRLSAGRLHLEGRLANRSEHRIDVISVPIIGDLSSGGRRLERVCTGYAGGETAAVWPRFANQAGYWGVPAPIQTVSVPESPFMLLQTEGEGLYLGCDEDETERTIQYVLELHPGASDGEGLGTEHLGLSDPAVPASETIAGEPVRIEAAMAQFVFAEPGSDVPLTKTSLSAYVGDWQVGADIYRRSRTERRRAVWPGWVDDVHAWQQIQLTSHEDELRYRYDDLVGIGEECVANGVSALQVTGWTLYGQDGRLPDHDIDPRLGTWDELRDAIAHVRALGVKVILYVKYTFADISTERYRTELHRYASRDEYGNEHVFAGYAYETLTQLAGINTRRWAVMCMNSEAWLDVCEREFIKTLELGADGILADENQHHSQIRYCFADDHGHAVPAHLFGGDLRLGERLRRLVEDRGAFLLAGEACYDAEYRDYALGYLRTVPQVPAVTRYVAPRQPLLVAVPGLDDRNTVNACLLRRYLMSYEPRHFRGRLGDAPGTLAYGRSVDALRHRYRELLWDGEYRDRQGAAIETSGAGDSLIHSVFSAEGAEALVIVNTGSDPIDVRYRFERVHHRLTRVSPEDPDERDAKALEVVGPRSAIVIFGKT